MMMGDGEKTGYNEAGRQEERREIMDIQLLRCLRLVLVSSGLFLPFVS